MTKRLALAILASTLAPLPALAAEISADVLDRNGDPMGSIQLHDTPSGMVHAIISLTGLPEGVHGIHLHQTGDCSAADFTSAGGHIAGDKQHGVMVEGGPHPGDLPNATVQIDGALQAEYFLSGISIEEDLMDEDGAAFVVHAGADDYQSQPAGDSGDRIACGEFASR